MPFWYMCIILTHLKFLIQLWFHSCSKKIETFKQNQHWPISEDSPLQATTHGPAYPYTCYRQKVQLQSSFFSFRWIAFNVFYPVELLCGRLRVKHNWEWEDVDDRRTEAFRTEIPHKRKHITGIVAFRQRTPRFRGRVILNALRKRLEFQFQTPQSFFVIIFVSDTVH